MQFIAVDNSVITDAVNIKNGVYAPLTGFLGEQDFYTVLYEMRLQSGEVWSLPIVLGIDKETARKLASEDVVRLESREGGEAVLEDIQIYDNPKEEFAYYAFGTTDERHPGVAGVMVMPDHLLGGRVVSASPGNRRFGARQDPLSRDAGLAMTGGESHVIASDSEAIPGLSHRSAGSLRSLSLASRTERDSRSRDDTVFDKYYLTPAQTRELFRQKGWERVVAFQTRNVPHRGHEFLQRYALDKHADGLFVQPVIGRKKPGDFRDKHIIGAYEVLFKHYYPEDRTHLGLLPLDMRYAGPREAVMHALIRRNYGCTHFIVGRDHAGVGDFYHPAAAHEIFDSFKPSELGIEVLKFGEVGYHPEKRDYAFVDECEPGATISFSGTELRNHLVSKKRPPEHLLRPEVYRFLVEQDGLFVEE